MNVNPRTVPDKLYFIESIDITTGKLIDYVHGYGSSAIPKLYRKGPATSLFNQLTRRVKGSTTPKNFYRIRSVTLILDPLPGISNIEECSHSFPNAPITSEPETKTWICEKCGCSQTFIEEKRR